MREPRLFRIERVALCLVTACFCPTDPPTICPAPVECVDVCCDRVTEAICGDPCPRGTVESFACVPDDRCVGRDGGPFPVDGGPLPEDAGPDDTGTICAPTDPGPTCYAVDDPCCLADPVFPTLTRDCRYRCPEGTAFDVSCMPDPSCEPETECEQPSECTTTAVECCAPCREHELEDVTGIRRDAESTYRDALCEDVGACPPCAPPPAPYLIATCNARACTAIDTRRLLLSQCSRDEECRVRATECCECGADTSPENLIALRIDGEGDYLNLVCDDDAICDDCVPTYPDTHEAFCDAGTCAVRRIGDGT